MKTIRIGIVGYGNLGKGVELAIRNNPDTALAFVATRRDPASVQLKTAGVPVYRYDDLAAHQADADVVIVCGGSAICRSRRLRSQSSSMSWTASIPTSAFRSISAMSMQPQRRPAIPQ